MQTPLLTSFEEKVSPDHTAVIVVDVQNDFCADDGFIVVSHTSFSLSSWSSVARCAADTGRLSGRCGLRPVVHNP